MPTIHIKIAGKRHPSLPSTITFRRTHTGRNIEPDQLTEFNERNMITSFGNMGPMKHCPLSIL